MNKKPFFKAAVRDDGTLELLFYEEIGNDGMGGGTSALDVKRQIDAAGSYDRILVRINSPGGDAFEGITIGNLIKAQKKPVTVAIDGVAASSAAIIAMCGDNITIASNAIMMIHNAWSLAIGDSVELRKMADTLDKVSSSIAQTFADKSGKSLDEIKAMMDAETWMSAQDCMDNGLATLITGEDKKALAFAKTFKSLKRHKALPKQLTVPECECGCDNCNQNDCENCLTKDCMDEDCIGCPNQSDENLPDEPTNQSNLSLYEARLKLLTHV